MLKLTNKEAAIAHERQAIYGDARLSHENIGLSWTGLIQQHYGIKLDHPLPDWLVEIMMTSFKLQRSCRVFHQDNFDDARVYLAFAERDMRCAHTNLSDGNMAPPDKNNKTNKTKTKTYGKSNT